MSGRAGSWLDLAARLFIGTVFLYAGVPKILDPCDFARSVYAYDLCPAILVNAMAIIIPWFEVIGGIAVILGIFHRGGALIITGLLGMFLVLLSITFIRGINFDCGCFSGSKDLCRILADRVCLAMQMESDNYIGRLRSGCEIIRDLVFLVPALFTLRFKGRKFVLTGLLGVTSASSAR
ncbi:DoxX family membrane protein [bacterium]|nr:DoxX family membrane protein [candidate division CSSED10-310 bacterium]